MGSCITRLYYTRPNETSTLSSFEYSSKPNIISHSKQFKICQNQTEFHNRTVQVFVEIEQNFFTQIRCLERLGSQLAYASGILSRLDIYS